MKRLVAATSTAAFVVLAHSADAAPRELARMRGRTFFPLHAGEGSLFVGMHLGNQTGVWKTDGTPEGTHMALLDGSDLTNVVALSDDRVLLRFGKEAGTTWSTDGTREGSWILPGVDFRPLDAVGVVNGVAIFGQVQTTPEYDVEHVDPFRTDGTLAGTYALARPCGPDRGSSPKMLGTVGGKHWLAAYTCAAAGSSPNNLALYATDGSSFDVVADVSPNGEYARGPFRGGATMLGGDLLFATYPGEDLPADIRARRWRIEPSGHVTPVSEPGAWSTLFWQGATHGKWFVSGRRSATDPLANALRTFQEPDVDLAPGFRVDGALAELSNDLLVTAHTGNDYGRILATDGTPRGTRPIADLAEGAYRFSAITLCHSPSRAIFGVHVLNEKATESVRREIWTTDGTSEGTIKLATARRDATIASTHAQIASWCFFRVANGLWMTDGTPARTASLHVDTQPWLDPPDAYAVGRRLVLALPVAPGPPIPPYTMLTAEDIDEVEARLFRMSPTIEPLPAPPVAAACDVTSAKERTPTPAWLVAGLAIVAFVRRHGTRTRSMRSWRS